MTAELWIAVGVALLLLRTIMGIADSNLVLVSRSRLRQIAEEGVHRAARLETLLDDRHTVHASLAVCRSTMSVLLGAIAVWIPAMRNATPGVEAACLGGTILVTLFLEMAARRLAWINPEKLGMAMVPFYVLVQQVTRPLLRPLSAMATGLARMLGGRPTAESDRGITEDDIRLMVEAGRDLEDSEKEMIHSIFELSETIAKEIMVPRVDMIAIEKNTPLVDVLDRCLEKGLSRLPVYDGTVDNVIGIITTRDLLLMLRENRMDAKLENIMRAAWFVPGSKRVDELLRDMQRDKISMAIVVDEYGGTDGLITMEDLIEEIVGEITDEYDKDEQSVELLADGSVRVDAKMIIEDVNTLLGTDIPADEYETIGGYVYGLLGHVPKEGEKAEVDGLVITVMQVQRQRITRVRIAHVNSHPFVLPESMATRGRAGDKPPGARRGTGSAQSAEVGAQQPFK